MRGFYILLTVVLLIGGWNISAGDKDYIQWWVSNHGDYAKTGKGKQDQRVKWAGAVFQRVKSVADKVDKRPPRLLVIGSRLGNDAFALPDGGVIINPRTLDFCYGKAGQAVKHIGDNRIAFVFGHELAHLADRHFSHREAFYALEKWGSRHARRRLARLFQLNDAEIRKKFRKNELMADKNGALYACMAGYDVGKLFWKENNFLTHWAKQTGTGMAYDDHPYHPSLYKRLLFLRPQLLAVSEKLELYRAGVLLFQLESYTDAASAFTRFSRLFPAREVFNNIGASYFNLAMRYIHLRYSYDYFRFRFSTLVDYDTTAETMTPRDPGGYLSDPVIAKFIDKAVHYFKKAVEKDPHNLTSKHNLAAAYILRMDHADALAVCKPLLEKFPRNVDALNNKSIALYYYGKEENLETAQTAIKLLQYAHNIDPNNHEVIYNLASIKHQRKRTAGAAAYWKKYLDLPTTPRDNYYRYVYKKIYRKEYAIHPNNTPLPPIPHNIRPGSSLTAIQKKLNPKNTLTYKLGSLQNQNTEEWYLNLKVIKEKNLRIVIIDDMPELIEWETNKELTKETALTQYGPPQKTIRHNSGHFYIYHTRGFSLKEIDGKIRSYIRYRHGF